MLQTQSFCHFSLLNHGSIPLHHQQEYAESEWILFLFAICSGSSHGAIHLLNSNLFGLSVFNMGLVPRHITEYNVTRLASGVLIGSIPQMVIQLLFVLEWGSEDLYVLYSGSTSFLSLCIGLLDLMAYRHSYAAVRKLMLEEDFTRPYFIFIKSREIYEEGFQLIHRHGALNDVISDMINVPSPSIEVNLCQMVPKGIKLCFVEYSGTRNAKQIVNELVKSIDDGWFGTKIQAVWGLEEAPVVELYDQQTMYEHRQLLTQDLLPSMYRHHEDENCCSVCWRRFCVCSCCQCRCCDTLRVSSQAQ